MNKQKAYWSESEARIIKNTVAKGLTDDEMLMFAHLCKRSNLDPLARQIYPIKRKMKKNEVWIDVLSVQTGIDGFRLIAERTGKYSPGKDTEFMYDEKGRLLGAKVYIKKMTDDGTWHDISATAFVKEYNTGKGLWNKMEITMIEKVAESKCLRRGFPADLSGLYTKEEMEQADTEAVEPVDELITKSTGESIVKCLIGRPVLRDELYNLFGIKAVTSIKQSQLIQCRAHVAEYIKKEKDTQADSDWLEQEVSNG